MVVAEDRTFERVVAGMIGLALVLFAIGWATRKDPAETPPIVIAGGGFIFNYRVAEVFYGFTALVAKPLPTGVVLRAEFEDPAGGPAFVVTKRLSVRSSRYGMQSPLVRGIEAGRPYHVHIALMDRTETETLWQAERSYTSPISDAIVPDKPLTIGPGYHRNPALNTD